MESDAKVPTEFIRDEVLITRKELRKTLPGILGLKTTPTKISFDKFCMVVKEYINVLDRH